MSNATAAAAGERALSRQKKNIMKITASSSAHVVNRKVVATRLHVNLQTAVMQCNAGRWRRRKFENAAFMKKPDGIISMWTLELLRSWCLPIPSIPMRTVPESESPRKCSERTEKCIRQRPSRTQLSQAGPALVEVKGNVCCIVKMSCMHAHQSKSVPQR